MRNLVKINAGIFSLQILAYVVVSVAGGSVGLSKIAMAIIAMAIAAAAIMLEMAREKFDEEADNLAITFIAVASAILQFPRDFLPGATDTIVVLMAFACVLFAVHRERHDGESLMGCFATAIPGMGILIGGAILSYRWLRRFYVSSG